MPIGKVALVGAGPGDPELLTIKALRLIQAANVVVYDRLIAPEILDMVPPGVARICVGKQPRFHPVPQSEINALLIRLASEGRAVVRLKGGDPMVFGRGSEEMEELKAAGIPCEIVPGITAASGCTAAAGIPLTHRGLATGVRFVTGHCRDDQPLELDWDGLTDPQTTLVVYMGLASMPEITERLVEHGMPGSTPVLAISRGTTPRQRECLTSVSRLMADVEKAALESPILFVIGKVAAMAASRATGGRPGDGVEPCHAAVV